MALRPQYIGLITAVEMAKKVLQNGCAATILDQEWHQKTRALADITYDALKMQLAGASVADSLAAMQTYESMQSIPIGTGLLPEASDVVLGQLSLWAETQRAVILLLIRNESAYVLVGDERVKYYGVYDAQSGMVEHCRGADECVERYLRGQNGASVSVPYEAHLMQLQPPPPKEKEEVEDIILPEPLQLLPPLPQAASSPKQQQQQQQQQQQPKKKKKKVSTPVTPMTTTTASSSTARKRPPTAPTPTPAATPDSASSNKKRAVKEETSASQ